MSALHMLSILIILRHSPRPPTTPPHNPASHLYATKKKESLDATILLQRITLHSMKEPASFPKPCHATVFYKSTYASKLS
jgi:hypothetical protein